MNAALASIVTDLSFSFRSRLVLRAEIGALRRQLNVERNHRAQHLVGCERVGAMRFQQPCFQLPIWSIMQTRASESVAMVFVPLSRTIAKALKIAGIRHHMPQGRGRPGMATFILTRPGPGQGTPGASAVIQPRLAIKRFLPVPKARLAGVSSGTENRLAIVSWDLPSALIRTIAPRLTTAT